MSERLIPPAPPATLVRSNPYEHTGRFPQVRSPAGLTLLYVHGVKNKPPQDVLRCQWDTALFGRPIDASRFAYWVSRRRYPQPRPETCASPDVTHDLEREATRDGNPASADLPGASAAERLWLEALRTEMLSRVSLTRGPVSEWIMRQITKAFIEDAHDFFFNQSEHDRIEAAFYTALREVRGPAIVIAHSLGSVIAYDGLRKMPAGEAEVPLFITIGSPLGLFTVEDILKRWSGQNKPLPHPAFVDKWINVADPHDPVASDETLRDDFTGSITDHRIRNSVRDDPHASSGYLESAPVREAVRALTSG